MSYKATIISISNLISHLVPDREEKDTTVIGNRPETKRERCVSMGSICLVTPIFTRENTVLLRVNIRGTEQPSIASFGNYIRALLREMFSTELRVTYSEAQKAYQVHDLYGPPSQWNNNLRMISIAWDETARLMKQVLQKPNDKANPLWIFVTALRTPLETRYMFLTETERNAISAFPEEEDDVPPPTPPEQLSIWWGLRPKLLKATV